MSIITLTEAKLHLHEDGNEQDSTISIYIGAAESSASKFMNRNIYASSIGSDLDGVVMDDAIKAACLLMVGHLFANREDVIVGASAVDLPSNSKSILYPYRISLGV